MNGTSLLKADDLAAFLRVKATQEGLQEAVDGASALVAGEIGCGQLEKLERLYRIKLLDTTSVIYTDFGPVTDVLEVKTDGVVTTDHYFSPSSWTLEFDKQRVTDQVIIVKYTTGWTDNAEDGAVLLPEIKQAVLMTAASVFNRPDAAASRVGVEGISFYKPEYITPNVCKMLERYGMPRYG